MSVPVPTQSFAEIALDLWLYRQAAEQAWIAGELLRARGGWAEGAYPGTETAIVELKASADMARGVYEMFRALVDHEPEVRAFFATLESREKKTA